MLRQEQILLILYDLALTIGTEDHVKPLAEKTLRRLVHHTGYPCGLFLLNAEEAQPTGSVARLTLAAAVGDHEALSFVDRSLAVSAVLVHGEATHLELAPEALRTLPLSQNHYRAALRLPIPGHGAILLFTADPGQPAAPFHNIFLPILANLAKTLKLCRDSEAYTAGLISDRDAARRDHHRFRSALDTSDDCIFLIDPQQMRFVDFNRTAEMVLGYTHAELLAMGPQDITPEFSRERLQKLFLSMSAGDADVTQDLFTEHRRRNGRQFPVEVRLSVLRQPGHGPLIIAVARDVTERKRAEERLFEEKERAQVTLNSIGDGVITTDPAGRIGYLNAVAERLTGWALHEAKGRALDEVFRIVDETTADALPNPVARCLREGRIIALANHTVLLSRWNTEVPIEHTAAPIRSRGGDIVGVVLVVHDVSHAREMARELSWQASHDSLTNLANRREFERRLDAAWQQARDQGNTQALLYIDLDQFKVVNDTCGHMAGDELLRQLAFHLRQQLGDGDVLARLGGDEFGVLLGDSNLEDGQRIAAQVRDRVAEFDFAWQEKHFRVGVSIGVVEINATAGTPAQMMSNADIACYAAKEYGGNRIHLYQPDDDELAIRQGEMRWVSRINDALAQERLVLYAQPIVPAGTTDVRHHYELLLRMYDEEQRIVMPGAFIPAAERFKMMYALDRWVIREAVTLHGRFCQECGETVFTINLSGNSITQDGLFDYIKAQFERSGVSPRNFCFEVTETAAIANIGRAQSLIRQVKELGCAFALDDFGSGLSSFSYLKNLPVDYLKIDGSFVKDILDDPIDASMVSAINDIGHVLGLKTIAEFVENEQVLLRLREIGVDYVQGYHLGRPAPLADLYSTKPVSTQAMMSASSLPLSDG